jgi:broad specificity phosphatase PhoE
MRKFFFVFLLLAILDGGTMGAGAQEVIFLVRHTEQAGAGRTDPPLTEAGQERAKRLAVILKDAGINQIFVTKWIRTVQTAESIAKSLRIHTKVYERDDSDGFVARLRTEHPQDRVLIIGHSLPITPLLKALGHPETIKIAPLEYDNLFVVIPKIKESPLVVRIRY